MRLLRFASRTNVIQVAPDAIRNMDYAEEAFTVIYRPPYANNIPTSFTIYGVEPATAAFYQEEWAKSLAPEGD